MCVLYIVVYSTSVWLQVPVARQYEAWLWQALNNGGFEAAARSVDERKRALGAQLQAALRGAEARMERARAALDELYGDATRQLVDACRAQMDALRRHGDALERARAAASRLQHARLYGDEARALGAETELADALRRDAASTCLRPPGVDDAAPPELRSPTDEQLRALVCRLSSLIVTRL